MAELRLSIRADTAKGQQAVKQLTEGLYQALSAGVERRKNVTELN